MTVGDAIEAYSAAVLALLPGADERVIFRIVRGLIRQHHPRTWGTT